MNIEDREGFLEYSALFLIGMLLGTILLAWLLDVHPILTVHWSGRDFGIGTLAAFAMMAAFGGVRSVRQQAEDVLGPLLAKCYWFDLIILAAFVGIIEELLFRGVLEQAIARYNPWLAIILVNLVFGILHAVSVQYAILAGLLGAILSILARQPGEYNLLRPIVAHGVYDYIGFIWIVSTYRRRQASLDDTASESKQSEEQGDGD